MGASLANRCDELRDPRLVNLIVSMYGDAPDLPDPSVSLR